MENHRKHSLGKRAFLLFLSRRIKLAMFLFILTGTAWYSERWAPSFYAPFVDYGVELLALFSVLYFLAMVLWTWFEYHFYTYMFTDEAFIMTYGYVERNELAALYHQIQNVNIQRSPLDRMAGVSKVIILMTGSQHDPVHNRIVLPAVGSKKAKLVQQELLSRARRHTMGSYPTAENRNATVSGPDR
ncbi:MAG TPA: PH domain-containing protein [Candidatus Paceibacterota bacterium]